MNLIHNKQVTVKFAIDLHHPFHLPTAHHHPIQYYF